MRFKAAKLRIITAPTPRYLNPKARKVYRSKPCSPIPFRQGQDYQARSRNKLDPKALRSRDAALNPEPLNLRP